MRFRLEENADLFTTPSAVMCVPSKDSDFRVDQCIEITASRGSAVAHVVRVRRSPVPVLQIDKYLKTHLGIADGEEVEVERVWLPEASKVVFGIAPRWKGAEETNLLPGLVSDRPILEGLFLPIHTFAGTPILVRTLSVHPRSPAIITETTVFEFEEDIEAAVGSRVGITYRDIGGLGHELQRVREIVEYPLSSPETFARLGIQPPRGVILHGPPGTGKTLIAKALSNEVGANFYTLQGPEVMSAYYGQSEQKLRALFEEARENAPAVILIEELDAIALRRADAQGELERRLVAQLLTLMDGLDELKGVVVIGTTNRIDAIDPALRRGGRFEHEISIGVPNQQGRREILAIHVRRMNVGEDVDMNELARRTTGFVGADLASLCREAGYCALRRVRAPTAPTEEEMDSLQVTREDFREALKNVRPSAMREFAVQIPRGAGWDQIGGLKKVKRLLQNSVVEAFRNPAAYDYVGVRPPTGVLLYGPPGTGKTLLARALASESDANYILIRGPELRSKWFGESERKLREIFNKAREVSPCIIIIDEVDALVTTRSSDSSEAGNSLTNQLLTEMDGMMANEDVMVLATTNRADALDHALLRSGRFDYQVEMSLPDLEERVEILRIHTRPMRTDCLDVQLLARETEGFSGADLREVCQRAGLVALRQCNFSIEEEPMVTMELLLAAAEEVRQTMENLAPRRVGFQR